MSALTLRRADDPTMNLTCQHPPADSLTVALAAWAGEPQIGLEAVEVVEAVSVCHWPAQQEVAVVAPLVVLEVEGEAMAAGQPEVGGVKTAEGQACWVEVAVAVSAHHLLALLETASWLQQNQACVAVVVWAGDVVP